MIPCLLVLGLVLACPAETRETTTTPVPVPGLAPAAPDTLPADAWLGQDKLQHLALSFAATSFASGLGRFALEPEPAAWTGAGLALLAGVAKETLDHRAGRGFSLRDLAWDAAGVAAALTLVHRIR